MPKIIRKKKKIKWKMRQKSHHGQLFQLSIKAVHLFHHCMAKFFNLHSSVLRLSLASFALILVYDVSQQVYLRYHRVVLTIGHSFNFHSHHTLKSLQMDS